MRVLGPGLLGARKRVVTATCVNVVARARSYIWAAPRAAVKVTRAVELRIDMAAMKILEGCRRASDGDEAASSSK